MILCIGTTPAAQRVMAFRKLTIDAVNRAVTTLDGVAGKSVNVAKVLQALGEHPMAVGFLGGDRGEDVRALLEERGIEQEFVKVAPRTRQCITLLETSAGTHTELVEESQPVAPADYEELMRVIRRRMKGCRAIVMSGTITPGGPVDLYYQGTQMAHAAGALPVVDAQGAALFEALRAKPALVKPNRPELAATLGRELKDEAAVMSAMRELCERGAQRVVITAGKDPALAFDGQSWWRVHAPRIAATNPIGCGDAFAAGLVWRLLRGEDLGQACRWAGAAGAANALTVQAGEVHRNDVERLAGEVRVEALKA
jgi:1-phosphofructokinase family hexose kinase